MAPGKIVDDLNGTNGSGEQTVREASRFSVDHGSHQREQEEGPGDHRESSEASSTSFTPSTVHHLDSETIQAISRAEAFIDAKHRLLGGDTGPLGARDTRALTGLPYPPSIYGGRDGGPHGYYVHCAKGRIFWHPSVGAHALFFSSSYSAGDASGGAILQRWETLGRAARSFLGWPSSDEATTADGKARFVTFASAGCPTGTIYESLVDERVLHEQQQQQTPEQQWTPGPFLIHGPIWERFRAHLNGSTASDIGYPLADEAQSADGWVRYVEFGFGGRAQASICHTLFQGDAHLVSGPIWTKWKALGGYDSHFGLPVTDETPVPASAVVRAGSRVEASGATFVDFAKGLNIWGSIYWTPTGGAKAIYGQIYVKWMCCGGHHGPLGFPVTDELETGDHHGRYNDFSGGGTIYFSWTTGAHVLTGGVPERLAWEVPDLAIEGGPGVEGSLSLRLAPSGLVEVRAELRNARGIDVPVSVAIVITDADCVAWTFGCVIVLQGAAEGSERRPRTDLVNEEAINPAVRRNWRVLTASWQVRHRAHIGTDWQASVNGLVNRPQLPGRPGLAGVQVLMD